MNTPSDKQKAHLQSLIHPVTRSHLLHHTNPGAKTLEVGCGPGQYRFAVEGSYIGIDLTAEEYIVGVPRLVDAIADAQYIPFKKEYFDLVFFSNILHYFETPEQVLQGALRVLKPGGRILVFDYSKKTLENLKKKYQNSNAENSAYPKTCAEWEGLFHSVGLVDIKLFWKKNRLFESVLRIFSNVAGDTFYYSWIDWRENGIILSGQKPNE